MSYNVAIGERNLGRAYHKRANRAAAAHDLDRNVVNLELALPYYREAARIFRAINRVDFADSAQAVVQIEESLREITVSRGAAAAAMRHDN